MEPHRNSTMNSRKKCYHAIPQGCWCIRVNSLHWTHTDTVRDQTQSLYVLTALSCMYCTECSTVYCVINPVVVFIAMYTE